MFSWFANFLRLNKGHPTNDVEASIEQESADNEKDAANSDLFRSVVATETNILVIVPKKEKETVNRLIRTLSELFLGGHHFFPGNMALMKCAEHPLIPLDYSRDALEQVVLTQKAQLETYDTPPTLLIFDKCVSQDDLTYRSVVQNNKEFRFTTLTVVSDACEIDHKLVNMMDIIILCKDRNKNKMLSRCRSIWERTLSKQIPFENFRDLLLSNVGSMKVVAVTTDGMTQIKFGKNDSSMSRLWN